MLPKLIVIAGTNASGKSGLGIELAAHYGGEVVSADSVRYSAGWIWAAAKLRRRKPKAFRIT